jgi:hypothetical protein
MGSYCQTQDITPAETTEFYPHPNYSSPNQSDGYSVQFVIDFSENADKGYTIVPNGSNGPANCKTVTNRHEISDGSS